ncbi:ABC transporter permease [Sansalvadorimonas verongulae]|uniref:ABC transporter permease n=1 Tax=Sansalvadorimonas verongulae TaxID=2172824 RepID=UPI0012BC5211|nr:ABC transporter permease [Sansalvadorimonas verongulae]MTI15402.1 ABC transporter permease [Sansalvadorimonas verongulae]
MFFTQLYQSWRHDKGRKALATGTIFLAASLISALLAVSISIGDKISVEMKSYGANIEITPEGDVPLPYALGGDTGSLGKDTLLLESELANIKTIFWRNNIMGFAPFVRTKVKVNDGVGSIPLVGTFFDKSLKVPDEPGYHTGNKVIASYWKVQGRWPNDEEHQALIGQALAERKGWEIGDVLTLTSLDKDSVSPVSMTITGILSNGEQEESAVVVPLAVAQKLTGLEGRVQTIKVSALTVPENELSRKAQENLESLDSDEYDLWFCTAFVSSISFQLEQALSRASVSPLWQVAASEGAVIEKIQSLLIMVTLAAFIVAAMGIASLMTNAILQRAKEIGLMKSLGAYNWQVYMLFYVEAAMCGLLGGLLGCISGYGLSRAMGYGLFGSALDFHWIIVPIVLMISVVITLCGTYFPAQRIAALYPIEVLYGRK